MEPVREQGLEFDYLVVGGGTAGCALASRLSQNLPEASIAVVEAGADITSHPTTQQPLGVFQAHCSEIDYQYHSVPQPQLGGRRLYNAAGKGLGGSSAINYGNWTRGCKLNYDLWAEIVGDEKWNYENMLPYFKRTENFAGKPPNDRGSEGPFRIASISASHPNRRYPLRDVLHSAYEQMGVKHVSAETCEDPIGISEILESWHDGKRQNSAVACGLLRLPVQVFLSSPVQKIIIDLVTKRATGIELTTGRHIHARKEIILSAGTHRSPQILMLSGIGPNSELDKYNIPIIHENPAVGSNMHGHPNLSVPFRLRDPSLGLAVGSEKFMSRPEFLQGFPYDWMVTGHSTEATAQLDPSDPQTAKLSDPKYAQYETFVAYAPVGQPADNLHLGPVPDGSIIGAIIVGFATTSRGTVRLSSRSALDPPVIDPQYLTTAYDRTLMRAGLRFQLNALLGTAQLRALIEREATPPDGEELRLDSTDAVLDERVRTHVQEFYHAAGTASMGAVVDTRFRVVGVRGLRVCDASVMPVPISAHLQACVYALAERAAEMITLDDGEVQV